MTNLSQLLDAHYAACVALSTANLENYSITMYDRLKETEAAIEAHVREAMASAFVFGKYQGREQENSFELPGWNELVDEWAGL